MGKLWSLGCEFNIEWWIETQLIIICDDFVQVRHRFELEDAFDAITLESERQRLFNEFIQLMQEACSHRHSRNKKKSKKNKKRSRTRSRSPVVCS